MAVATPTVARNYGPTTRTAATDTTSSFTPSANALLVAAFHGVTDQTCTITDSTGLTWNVLNSTTFNSSNRYTAAWAEVGSSPSSMTVTATWGASFTGYVAGSVIQMTGQDTTTPVIAASVKTGSGTSATFSTATVPALSSSGNLQLMYVFARGGAITPEGGWTELVDLNGGVNSELWCGYIGTPGDTSPTATDTAAGSRAYAALAFEVSEPLTSGVVGTSTALRASRRRRR